MAAGTYTARVIVLRKTKLGETDLILTLLSEDGSQIRAVAKGARKPQSQFSSRLELCAEASVLIAHGRSLDIIKEARLEASNDALRCDMERATGAACMAELLDRVTQMGLESPKLFDMTRAAFARLATAPIEAVPALTAAHLLKTLAFSGLRPSLSTCVVCGKPVNLANSGDVVFVSYADGGIVCPSCAPMTETIRVSADLCIWINALLGSTFDEAVSLNPDLATSFSLLQFCQTWIREHVGSNLKSLQFMFTGGLY